MSQQKNMGIIPIAVILTIGALLILGGGIYYFSEKNKISAPTNSISSLPISSTINESSNGLINTGNTSTTINSSSSSVNPIVANNKNGFNINWGNADNQIGYQRYPGWNAGPSSFFVDENNNEIDIIDPVNERISRFDLNGNFLSSFKTSLSGWDIYSVGDKYYIYDLSSSKIEIYNKDGSLLGPSRSFADINLKNPFWRISYSTKTNQIYMTTSDEHSYPLTANGSVIKGTASGNYFYYLLRKDNYNGEIHTLDELGNDKNVINIHPINTNHLGDLIFVGTDSKNNIYIISEEFPVIKNAETSVIKRYLEEYSQNGELVSYFEIPYGNYSDIRVDTRVAPSGKIYQMLPTKNYVEIIKY